MVNALKITTFEEGYIQIKCSVEFRVDESLVVGILPNQHTPAVLRDHIPANIHNLNRIPGTISSKYGQVPSLALHIGDKKMSASEVTIKTQPKITSMSTSKPKIIPMLNMDLSTELDIIYNDQEWYTQTVDEYTLYRSSLNIICTTKTILWVCVSLNYIFVLG